MHAFEASDLCLNKPQIIEIYYYNEDYNINVINFDFTNENAINISIQTSDADLTLTFKS